jgi:hypothetical protein
MTRGMRMLDSFIELIADIADAFLDFWINKVVARFKKNKNK